MPVDFDGIADFIAFAANSVYDGLVQKSIFLRTESDGVGGANVGRLLWKTSAGDAAGWSIVRNDSGNPRANRLAYVHSASGDDGVWETDNATFPVSTEISIGISMDASDINNAPILYLDGVPVNVTEFSTPTGSFDLGDTEGLQVGKAGGSIDALFYNGKIWNINLFNTILTPADFATLHDSKIGGLGMPGHIFWTPFLGSDGKLAFTGALAGTNFVYDHISGIKGTPTSSPVAIQDIEIALPFAYG